MDDNSIEGFEMYRRQRQRVRRLASLEEPTPVGGPNSALRELEAVEQREFRDQQLQREVNDFFESATQQAADIVRKVAESAKLKIDERLSTEMQEFLMDSLTRMQDLVHAVLTTNTASTAEEVIEPLMHNLRGQVLDGFRAAGARAEEHFGQDPLKTDLEDVRREFRSKIEEQPARAEDEPPLLPGVAANRPLAAYDPRDPTDDERLAARFADPPPRPQPPAAREPGAEPESQASFAASLTDEQKSDLQRFKRALETLVRQGNMSKDEARTAWETRKATLRKLMSS